MSKGQREMTHEELKYAYMKKVQRVQELEEDYEYLSHHYGIETEQNKRYREAIKRSIKIARGNVLSSPACSDIETILLEALEGEE